MCWPIVLELVTCCRMICIIAEGEWELPRLRRGTLETWSRSVYGNRYGTGMTKFGQWCFSLYQGVDFSLPVDGFTYQWFKHHQIGWQFSMVPLWHFGRKNVPPPIDHALRDVCMVQIAPVPKNEWYSTAIKRLRHDTVSYIFKEHAKIYRLFREEEAL